MDKELIRGKMLQLFETEPNLEIPVRDLLRQFNQRDLEMAKIVVSEMLGDNILVRIGRGVKGDPLRLILNTAIPSPKI